MQNGSEENTEKQQLSDCRFQQDSKTLANFTFLLSPEYFAFLEANAYMRAKFEHFSATHENLENCPEWQEIYRHYCEKILDPLENAWRHTLLLYERRDRRDEQDMEDQRNDREDQQGRSGAKTENGMALTI